MIPTPSVCCHPARRAPLGVSWLVGLLLLTGPLARAQGPVPEARSTDDSSAPVGRQEAGWTDFQRLAREQHGDLGARAAAYLAAFAPDRDAGLDAAFLLEHLTLALEARERFPWAAAVPEELYFENVLPYAVLDETREPWRRGLLEVAAPLAREATSLTDAAQRLNRGLFNALDVHYNTGRKRPNQSPAESIAQKRATCTGLTVLLVDACRAVGVPARAAGVASWHDDRGNHTWVEFFDGEAWRFVGADEYDAAGVDRGWFTQDAARAIEGDPRYAVWASAWRRTDAHFPLAWAPRDFSVAAVDVTARYTRAKSDAAPTLARRSVRLWAGPTVQEREGRDRGERLVATLVLYGADGAELAREVTRAGRADLNDMPVFALAEGEYDLALERGGERRWVHIEVGASGDQTLDLDWSAAAQSGPSGPQDAPRGLDRAGAAAALTELWAERQAELTEQLAAEYEARAVIVGDHTLKFAERRLGDAPAGKRSLWISMHGGGGAPREVNDRQWANQVRLYDPEEGFYVAPRAPTDTWNLWHQDHIDPLFQRLIDLYVATQGVDPDRVYLLGYSAGGDGVYQLAPRMADRFAAAAMMAGHPNEAQQLGLRNLPFTLFMGGNDGAYDRNAVAASWGARLDALAAADPGGYPHRVTIYPGLGHWMDGKDAEALPWMAAYTRVAWPKRIVWYQDDVVHTRFYWLGVPEKEARAGRTVWATVEGQTITLEAPELTRVTLRLADELLDLDQSVRVLLREGDTTREVFAGLVSRERDTLRRSLAERADPRTAASANLEVQLTRD